ncbi:hypothetical protein TraAM80_06533 [Trypanosoma rangeli]|uniref:Uncharacterized protein n=1 Tax=Trypanosoma rangeli TaxID=5698 RepID=A0A422N9R8_TRYRA|nr:uncharacterized protein TraAM80_06533 [Trypanosoma rangeli]RNF02205.1 hypothetical protein TraAM80_06533 [Trypanosoma rangeli]|eukprot:RNF02205.1 hypothetical protein TraAM80_06533 [Trypanosoma rangeli]
MTECGGVHVPCESLCRRPLSSSLRGEEASDLDEASYFAMMRMTLHGRGVMPLNSALSEGGHEASSREHNVALGDVASITVQLRIEGGILLEMDAGRSPGHKPQATPLANQWGGPQTQPPPSSIILLKLQDGGEVEICGVSIAGNDLFVGQSARWPAESN